MRVLRRSQLICEVRFEQLPNITDFATLSKAAGKVRGQGCVILRYGGSSLVPIKTTGPWKKQCIDHSLKNAGM